MEMGGGLGGGGGGSVYTCSAFEGVMGWGWKAVGAVARGWGGGGVVGSRWLGTCHDICSVSSVL
jgi:hypothetical protein